MNEVAWRHPPTIIETALDRALPEPSPEDEAGHAELCRAVRYAVFGGGKRLRSRLLLEAAYVVAGDEVEVDALLPAAGALEMIHAYSLVHDDLPAMDDADTRRGQPSCHKRFGEAMAILAGDALLTRAFELAATPTPGLPPEATLQAVQLIAAAAGEAGMVGGQAIDVTWSNLHDTSIGGEQLLAMHARKTGALIAVASQAGAQLAGGTAAQVAALRAYGLQLGRAFQISDDLLDIEGDPEVTGKVSTDATNFKITAPSIFGVEASRGLAAAARDAALQALAGFGERAAALRHLAEFVVARQS